MQENVAVNVGARSGKAEPQNSRMGFRLGAASSRYDGDDGDLGCPHELPRACLSPLCSMVVSVQSCPTRGPPAPCSGRFSGADWALPGRWEPTPRRTSRRDFSGKERLRLAATLLARCCHAALARCCLLLAPPQCLTLAHAFNVIAPYCAGHAEEEVRCTPR